MVHIGELLIRGILGIMNNKISILGNTYTISENTEENDSKLTTRDGYTELWSKEVVIRTGWETNPESIKCPSKYKEKVLRHELFHAIFHECGLSEYGDDETLVEFLAIQFPKIVPIMEEANKIYGDV